MQDSVYNWTTALPLIIAVLALLATLALSLPAVYGEGRALRAAQSRGMFLETIRADAVCSAKRRELLRVFKHALAVAGIAISFAPLDIHRAIMLRNGCFCAISLLMLLNTLLDHLTRRRAMRYAAEHPR